MRFACILIVLLFTQLNLLSAQTGDSIKFTVGINNNLMLNGGHFVEVKQPHITDNNIYNIYNSIIDNQKFIPAIEFGIKKNNTFIYTGLFTSFGNIKQTGKGTSHGKLSYSGIYLAANRDIKITKRLPLHLSIGVTTLYNYKNYRYYSQSVSNSIFVINELQDISHEFLLNIDAGLSYYYKKFRLSTGLKINVAGFITGDNKYLFKYGSINNNKPTITTEIPEKINYTESIHNNKVNTQLFNLYIRLSFII